MRQVFVMAATTCPKPMADVVVLGDFADTARFLIKVRLIDKRTGLGVLKDEDVLP